MKLDFPNVKNIITSHQETLTNVILGVVIFQLSLLYSKDWATYQLQYDTQLAVIDWGSFISKLNVLKEPIYLFCAKLFGQLFGYQTFVLFATVGLLTFKLHFLRKITHGLYVSAFFYICFYLFLFEGTAIRVGYAVAFVMAGLYYLKHQKWLYAFILIMIASQIHLSTLLFLIVFPIYFFRSIKILICLLFIISPLFIIFDISIVGLIQNLLSLINNRYALYFDQAVLGSQNSTGLFYYFIAFFTMMLTIVAFYLKDISKSDNFMQTIIVVTLSAVVAMCIFHDYVALSARIGELLLLPIVILLSQLYMEFCAKNMCFHRYCLIVLSLMFLSSRVMYLYPTMLYG